MSSTDQLPPFPENIPTHPLLVVDFALLAAGDAGEADKLWTAATQLGFWYLKNHGADAEVDAMFDVGAATMALPLDEKLQYTQPDDGVGVSFGYKPAGSSATDATGARDGVEFLNIARDDARAWPGQAHRAYPPPVRARMADAVAPFVRRGDAVAAAVLAVLERRLKLPEGALARRHAPDEWSGSEARCIRRPPGAGDGAAIGAHTDFGSLSFLHNRLGGLQVLVPGAAGWQYVKPVEGHAICNIGDALTVLSGGILRSCMHRVVAPPGTQADYVRWSLVYFTRPGNDIVLHPLTEESPDIASAAVRARETGINFETGETAGAWFSRRVRGRRIRNRKGPETWIASEGMESISGNVSRL